MQKIVLLVIVACVAGIAAALWRHARVLAARRRVSEQRSAALLAEAAEAIRARTTTPGRDAPG